MKDLIRSLLGVLRHAARLLTLVRNTVLNILFLLLCAVLLFSLFSTSPPDTPVNSILRLQLVGDIVEEKRTISSFKKFLEESLGINSRTREILLQDILDIIDTASKDENIRAIVLDLNSLGDVGLNQLQIIGQALEQFKNTGKEVVAAEDYYSQKQYYLASYADTVILNPMGGVELHGFGLYRLYFQESLEKLSVNYHVFKVGTYKSALEPITRNSMSDEARQQNAQWLNTLWHNYLADLEKQRSVTALQIEDYINNLNVNLSSTQGDTAQLALSTGLVDHLMTREEIHAYLCELSGQPASEQLDLVSSFDYLSRLSPSYSVDGKTANTIGVLIAEGNILDGRQPAGIIGGDTLSELIRQARMDEKVKALVLRINSGGGSAFASEIIRQELLELKKTGKPLIVSMGSMAASGGYWIAADADEIWAAPTTITGSIGIFGAIPTFESTLDKVGIHSDGVGTTKLSAGVNLAQPLSPILKESIQLTVNNGYERFLTVVATGRKLDRNQVDAVAQGRVFSGTTAQSLGLVDKLGNLQQAIEAAAEMAGIENYSAAYITKPTSLQEQLLQLLAGKLNSLFPTTMSTTSSLTNLLELFHNEVKPVALFNDPRGIYAHAMLQLPQ